MNLTKILLSIGLTSTLLVGCGTNNGKSGVNDNNNTRPVRYTPNDNNDIRYNNVRYNNPNYNNGVNNTNDNTPLDTRNGNGVNGVNNNNNNNNNRMAVADKVADRVADLKEVDRANVIVTDHTAYVAVLLSNKANNDKLAMKLKNKISKVVKKADKSVKNVYISENPDFFDQMNDYAKDIRSGRPVSGLFNQFNDMIQRVFPNGAR
ncbi:YhcN/YlaJ family sporulation lipoprotein [Heyndrickxia ginsengihumi]|uniref:YhcN/YlaJ family sporulation lipoprotein n=1 Tax=Heyndrickxia ginsengihumi TaxID=363870 RepID=UPI003D1DBEB3